MLPALTKVATAISAWTTNPDNASTLRSTHLRLFIITINHCSRSLGTYHAVVIQIVGIGEGVNVVSPGNNAISSSSRSILPAISEIGVWDEHFTESHLSWVASVKSIDQNQS